LRIRLRIWTNRTSQKLKKYPKLRGQ
jgi:hypothetical protein